MHGGALRRRKFFEQRQGRWKVWRMNVHFENSGAVMGTVVTGVDLRREPDVPTAQLLYKAFLENGVLGIRGQNLTPQQYLTVGRIFGDPQVQLLADYRLEDQPEITIISNFNKMGNGKPHVRATYWHTDDSYFAVPAKATLLHARALPSSGGDTGFINCQAVLEAMPGPLRRRITGRRAVHKYLSRRGRAKVAVRTADEQTATPDVSHPLIRTHPETGIASLYINPNRIDHVEGMSEADSDALLDEVYAFAFEERFQYRYKWQLGDVVIWDNRCTMHRANTDFDVNQRREFHRILLKGTKPQ